MAQLNYAVTGNPEGPWITLSHSLATSMCMWDPQLPALEEQFQVLLYDTRGHGESLLPSDRFTVDDLAQDVVNLWDELGIKTSHFLGLSLGGMTGVGLALNHPDRINKLIACDCRVDAPEAFQQLWDRRIKLVSEDGLETIVEEILDTWISDRSTLSAPEIKARALILSTNPASYLACAGALKQLDYKSAMTRISVPTLYIVGANDGPHPAAMQEMAELTTGATLITLRDAAHLANLEQPEAFNQAVLDFLTR